MPSFVPTSADTLEDQRLYTSARLVEVACLDCLARVGVKPGDVIFAIDKEPVYDLTLAEAEQKLRGPAGSEVVLTMRQGTEKPVDLVIRREAYKLGTVTARLERGNTGYIRIAGFDNETQAALAEAVQDLLLEQAVATLPSPARHKVGVG